MSATSPTEIREQPAEHEAGVEQLCVDTIRTLSIDAVEQARSGHPGLPLAMAPIAYLLYTRFLRHDPDDPAWPDRDRFILSAGHGSALLYSVLHLAGYALSLDDLRQFRQWGSITPGHPERGLTPGVEVTTGPLGQGFANGVGMALAERFLRERYGSELIDHRVFAICSDGDLMEGVSAEAASLAGHLGLGRLVYLYDDNGITIDGDTSLSFATEDVEARFRAYDWHTVAVEDANDLRQLSAAIEEAISEWRRPSLIRVRSVIGYPAPNKQGSSAAHGAPLGEQEARATKVALGWDPDATFVVPDPVREAFAQARQRGALERAAWSARFDTWAEAEPALAEEWARAWQGLAEPGLAAAIPAFSPAETPALATRTAGGRTLAALSKCLPTMVGGSADLAESTKTVLPDGGSFTRAGAGRTVRWGVREHAMGAAVNGLALHGGIVKPFGSTFLVFSDYMRPSLRLSALMGLPVVWVFTHDSVAVGEDGPTHQPVEHYAALRAIPGLTVIRPADANEAAQAWRVAIEHLQGPVCLLLTRQDLPVLPAELVGDGVDRGGYVLKDSSRLDVVLVATGSEVSLALEAAVQLELEGVGARVVSMPSCELFDGQTEGYREMILPPGVPAVSIEAGVSQGWSRLAGANVSIDRFGASAPGEEVLAQMGITVTATVLAARQAIQRRSPATA
ncbi:MAG: transketolase [Solirubrobacteraceae bacterium]